jgi:1-hydroxycarotenoid 3,4-desaturase
LHVLARHYWSGGHSFDLFADRKETTDAIGRFAGAAEAAGYEAFAQASQRIHHALRSPFLKSQRPSPWGLAAAMPIRDMLRINPFETLWHALGRYFKDRRLHQLFGRYATYCGSSPFKAPATLMLVADVEASGVWRVQGGMAALATALKKCAEKLGVAFHYGSQVMRIECAGGRPAAVIDDSGRRHACRNVVLNADSASLAHNLFGSDVAGVSRAPSPSDRSLSAVTWCGHIVHTGAPLEHHTVFFSDDYEAEFRSLNEGTAPDPTVYVCDQGHDNKLVLVNAAANGLDAPGGSEERMLNRLSKCGSALQIDPASILRRSPADFAKLYPATHGALYGRASHGWMSTFLRPQARTRIPGLYLAGGSTHPGPGVPMATLSGMRAAEALLSDHISTRR